MQRRSLIQSAVGRIAGNIVGGILGVTLSFAASAQTKWDLPTPYADSIYHTANVRTFVDDVKKATNGALDITVHSNASLIKHPDSLRAVQTGQVNIAEFLISQFGNDDPMFEVDSLPFTAIGFDAAWKLYQAHKPALEKSYQKRGIRMLFSVPWPGQAIFTKNELKSAADLKGVKFRTYNPITSKIAEGVGAIPTTVQAAELPQAFATGVVSAMITSSSTGVSSKAWEFSKYYYDTNAFHPRNAVVVNERAYAALLDNVKVAVQKAAADAEKRGWEMARKNQGDGIAKLKENGMMIVQPDAALAYALIKVGDGIAADWVKKAGADGETIIKTYRSK